MRNALVNLVLAVAAVVVLITLAFVLPPLSGQTFLFGSLGLVGILLAAVAYLAMCFTYVAEGTSKQLVRGEGFLKSMLSKKGHKYKNVRKGDWDVTRLAPGEKPWPPEWMGGYRFVSLLVPLGIDKIYTRTMKYVKSLPKGTPEDPNTKYEKRADPGTDFLLTGTQYQYAVLVESAEDANGLPLSGQMTLSAEICNPYKALFLVKDWFDALVSRVLPRVRQYISEHTYEDIINNPGVQLDQEVMKMLKETKDETDIKGRCIVDILMEDYGIHLIALETVNIDPPEAYRETTLRKYTAAQNAQAEAEETGGALERIIDRRVSKLAERLGMDADEIKQHLRDHKDVYERIESIGLDLVRRDRAGGGLREIRIANADGSNMDPITGALMAMISSARSSGDPGQQPPAPTKSRKRRKQNQNPPGPNPTTNPQPAPVPPAPPAPPANP